jgi:uncharacterized phiE125 gp8 family phage protein
MLVRVLTPPAEEPVSLADLRAFARLDETGEDNLLARFIAAARMAAETFTGLALVTRTVAIDDAWPVCSTLALPVWPVEVSEVQGVTAAGVGAPLAPEQWRVDATGRPAVLTLDARPPEAVSIAVIATAGFGPASATPETLKLAVLSLAAHFYDRRHDDDDTGTLPPAARRLLAPWRRARL